MIPEITIGGGGILRNNLTFEEGEIHDVDEATVTKAYENSLNVAAAKMRKTEDVGGQIEGMQRQREIGRGLMQTIRQTTPPPPAGGPPR